MDHDKPHAKESRSPIGALISESLLVEGRSHPLDGVRGHELMPADVARKIPKLYSTENEKDPTAHVKFFSPYGNSVWYITEYDEDLFRGFAILNEDYDMAEWGYISLGELKVIKLNGRPHMEEAVVFHIFIDANT